MALHIRAFVDFAKASGYNALNIINPLQSGVAFLYPLKTSVNL